ncbi:MAG: ComEC/Rec2 family competence protein [Schumannella sp.]
MRRDLRLAGPACVAWLAAGVAVGCREGLALAAAAGWVVALGVVVAVILGHSGRARAGALGAAAVTAVVAALVLSAAAAGQQRRESSELLSAAESGRSVNLVLEIVGRPAGERVRVSAGGAPILLFGAPGDEVLRSAGIGDRIAATGALRRAEAGDQSAFLMYARDRVRLLAEVSGPLGGAQEMRDRFARLASALPGPGGRLLPGLAIGDTSAVPAALDSDMKAASLSHLTAVSGSNCVVVVGIAFVLAGALGVGRTGRIVLALAALGGFVVLVTPEPSVQRAAVMAAVGLIALASSRARSGIPVLCLAVIGLLAADPWLARSYGFALSVLATAGLIVLARPLAERLGRRLPRWLALVIAVPTAAQLACQPVLLMLDPALPLYGVPANLLAEPAAPLATVAGLAACLLTALLPPLAAPVAWIAWLPASWIAGVASFFAGLPEARSPWPTGPPGVVLMGVVTVVAAALILGAGSERLRAGLMRAMVLSLAIYLAVLAGGRVATLAGRPGDWQIALCDVGQGDAVVIRSAGQVALIDTGPDPAPLGACLDRLGVGRIQLLVLTHSRPGSRGRRRGGSRKGGSHDGRPGLRFWRHSHRRRARPWRGSRGPRQHRGERHAG